MKTVAFEDDNKKVLAIQFQSTNSAEWAQTLKHIKMLSGRVFDSKRKLWTSPNTKDNWEALKLFGFDMPFTEPLKKRGKPPWTDIDIVSEDIKLLRPYQVDGLKFLKYRKGRGLIAWDMGLGKTVGALTYLNMSPSHLPVLIVVPASIKRQWQREYTKWTGNFDIEVINGRTPYQLSPDKSYIINWDILMDWTGTCKKKCVWDGVLSGMKFNTIIGDEIQYASNTQAKRTKAFRHIARRTPNLIALSGTPIKSRPAQFWSILNLLEPKVFPNEWHYKWRYCNPKHNGFGWNFKGASHIPELRDMASDVILRCMKKDVLKDLPDKIRAVIPLERCGDKEEEEYERLEKLFFGTRKYVEQKAIFQALQYSAFDLKREAIVKWIREWLDTTDEKLVCFFYHRRVGDYLHEMFRNDSVHVDGSVTGSRRDKGIQQFINKKETRLLFGQILATGVGLDGLQGVCSNAAFVEFGFNPTDHWQAEDRLHRIGQKDSVVVNYLIAEDTLEEDMITMLEDKANVFSQLIDGQEEGGSDFLMGLIKKRRGDGSL